MWEELLKLETNLYILGLEYPWDGFTSTKNPDRVKFDKLKKTVEGLYEKMLRSDLLKPLAIEFSSENKTMYFNIGKLNPKLSGKRGINPYGIFGHRRVTSPSEIIEGGFDVGIEIIVELLSLDIHLWTPEGEYFGNRFFDLSEMSQNNIDIIYNWIEKRVVSFGKVEWK